MGAITSSQHERAEVDAVLNSGLFEKAPRLGKFFIYICERHFEGNADQIKEYSIAVEALGRQPDFDSKRDSIVRVEAHRLRKRLDEYYKGSGADHPVHVVIPNGQYRPHFIPRGPEANLVAIEGQSYPASADRTVEPALQRFKWRWPLFAAALLLLACLPALFAWRSQTRSKAAEDVWAGASAEPVPAEFRMLAGYHGIPFVDRQGHPWLPDAYYKGGTSLAIPADRFIEGAPDPRLFKAQRSGSFRYDIPVSAGTHEVHLYFAETDYGRGNARGGGEGSRTFDIALNGQFIERVFDPLAEAGAPNRLYEHVLKDVKPGTDGKIHLAFSGNESPATLNAIEILSSFPGRVQPIRIVTQNAPVTDSDGRVWAADEYFYGGTLAFRPNLLLDRAERSLFQGERYGNFSYRIPLAPGQYKLTLHFVESWFGTSYSHFASVDSRSFDVYANGIALLRGLSVGKEANGPNRVFEKTFEDIVPNAQGMLLLEFIPIRNYAELNAIEVVQSE